MHPLDERKKNGYVRANKDTGEWEYVLGGEASEAKYESIRAAANALENAREAAT